ncbi:MAG: alpha-galactosidase [Oscillospiraceae bacterium]|nr:alpha-galactosidase [Oscillospiraceae bacterium]
MIECNNGLFHLKNESFSYLFRVTRYGLLEQIHFGAPIESGDAEALACRPGLGWGGSILLNDRDSESCSDAIPLAWSGSGRGDYRESPLEVDERPTEFCYVNHRVLQEQPTMQSGLPLAHGSQETLEITLAQPGAKLYLYFTLFETALTRRAVLENAGQAPMELHKLMSFCLDLPGEYSMTTFNGGWSAEMGKHTVPVAGSRVVNESTTGFSSHRHNPGFLLSEPDAGEDHGRVYGFNLVYSGNHYASAQRSLQGLTRVMQGISPSNFTKVLKPGEKFETPEAVLCYCDEGFGGLSQRMHRFVNDHIVPENWRGKERPVLYNSWEGCMFDFDQRKLLDLAKRAKDLGCELFVLDDGWFGARDHDKAGLGDYNVNLKKLPQGLDGLAQRINKIGLDFGLWFEPESVNPDSDLYRAHPDWALGNAGFSDLLGRNQLLLDLSKPEVRDYIVENVGRTLDGANISYVKWDMNRHSVALGARAHDHILGLYDVLRRIFGPRPNILLESCSSGGNRFDLGMLCFSPQVWCSDDTDPIERLTIQGNLSYLYPQSTFGAHVSASPHAQTLRATPLTTRGNVSFFGLLGYELDLKHLLPVEIQEIKAQTELYKKYRHVFQYGTFRRLKNGWQVSDGVTTIAGVFHKLVSAAPAYEQLRLKGLDKEKRYLFRTRAQKIRVGQFAALIKHVAPVNLNPNGAILRTADKVYALDDGVETYHVSGAALMAGITLLPLFRGTGYDANQRTQGDFGSSLYVVEEEASN